VSASAAVPTDIKGFRPEMEPVKDLPIPPIDEKGRMPYRQDAYDYESGKWIKQPIRLIAKLATPEMDRLCREVEEQLKENEIVDQYQFQRRAYDAMISIPLDGGWLYTCHFLVFGGKYTIVTWEFGKDRSPFGKRTIHWFGLRPAAVLGKILEPLEWYARCNSKELEHRMGFNQPRVERVYVE